MKAPTLVCDDGTVLMDSTLLLQYAESLAHPRSLLPADPAALRRDLHLQGFALAACEKAVQLVYEHAIRPEEKRHAPWIERVRGQMRAGFEVLERELAAAPLPVAAEALTQAAVTIAVVWTFVRETRTAGSHLDPASTWTALDALTDALEALPAFRRAPHGDGVVGEAR